MDTCMDTRYELYAVFDHNGNEIDIIEALDEDDAVTYYNSEADLDKERARAEYAERRTLVGLRGEE